MSEIGNQNCKIQIKEMMEGYKDVYITLEVDILIVHHNFLLI